MHFEILINDFFSTVNLDSTITSIDNKKVLSICNDFENGLWRYEKFQKFIWNNIKETALSSKERSSLITEGEDSLLTESAKNLRLSESEDDIGRGSELAEIALYGIMKNVYGALPVVPKIFYKQNRNDNAKGADSVHIVVEGNDKFSLWFGESKFYNSIENARLDKIIASVKESLSIEKLKKENSIITNVSDLNDLDGICDSLKERIKNILSPNTSIDTIKPILNIPILLIYECKITKETTEFNEEYKNSIIEHQKIRATEYFKKQIDRCSDVHLYSEIKFHIILFPVPEKKPIIDKFILKAEAFRN